MYRKLNTFLYTKNNPLLFCRKGHFFSSKPVSRVLCRPKAVSIINLILLLLTGLSNLPILATHLNESKASNFRSRTYLVFQLLRFTAIPVARESRELLPHVFTLTPDKSKAVYSLWHLLSPADGAFPLGSRILYVARTFLFKLNRSDRTFCSTKVRF